MLQGEEEEPRRVLCSDRHPAGVMAVLQQIDNERSNAAVMHPSPAENLSIHGCISFRF
jgi:hypothetical protein